MSAKIISMASSDKGVLCLTQHPLLQASKGAREGFLLNSYIYRKFNVTFDVAIERCKQTELTRGLEMLGEELSTALFMLPGNESFVSLTITFVNFEHATIHAFLESIELLINGYINPDKLTQYGIATNWAFNMRPMLTDLAVFTSCRL